jgi:hypothetical protein
VTPRTTNEIAFTIALVALAVTFVSFVTATLTSALVRCVARRLRWARS